MTHLRSTSTRCADALLNAQGACMIKQDWSFGRKSLTMHQVETLLREWNNKEKYYCEERDAAEQQAQTEQFTLARQFMGGQDATSNHNISRPQIMDTSSVVNPSPQEQQANPQPPQWLGGPPQHQPLGLQPSQDRQQMSLSSTSNPNLQQQPYNQPAYGGQLALQSNSAQNQLTPWQPQWSQQQQREDQQIFGYPPNSITSESHEQIMGLSVVQVTTPSLQYIPLTFQSY